MQDAILRGTVSTKQMGLTAFDPLLSDFDAIILLRRECMPEADSALLSPGSPEAKKVRLLPRLLPAAGFAGSEEDLIVPPKSARALLRSIPKRECPALSASISIVLLLVPRQLGACMSSNVCHSPHWQIESSIPLQAVYIRSK